MSSEQKRTRKKSVEKKAEGALKEAEKEVEKAAKVVKQEAKKAEKALKLTKRPRTALARPSGRVPEATVASRHGSEMITRAGRGFSMGELKGAGIPPRLAARWGARVDMRRGSVLEGNVSSLKAWHSHATLASAVRREASSAEAKIEGVAKDVEAAVEVIEEEAAGAEKAAKKEVKKAAKVVKEKVERKPRSKKKESA